MQSNLSDLVRFFAPRPVHAVAAALVTILVPRGFAQETVFISDHPELLISSQQDWGELGLNVAAHAPGTQGQPLRIGTKNYAQGLGHHAHGSIIVLLDARYTAFDAEVGIQPCPGASVIFRVFVDGQKRFDTGVLSSGEAAKPVHVELTGAQELRLEANDAGDGINCDMANWAEARLTPAAGPMQARAQRQAVDMAPFARVVTWDPNRAYGAQANRVQEFRQEDLFTETGLKPHRYGAFTVPAATNGLGCIGLQWLNRRAIRQLGLEFREPTTIPASGSVRVEAWFGESVWQGNWKPLEGKFKVESNGLVFRPESSAGVVQTHKIRWILPASSRRPEVRLSAFTRSSWTATNVFVQLENPKSGQRAALKLWNGELATASETDTDRLELSWEVSRPLRVGVRYSRPSSLNSDPTLLQFHLPGGNVSVAVADVLSNSCVYLPDFGLFVARDPLPVTLAEYKHEIAGRKTVLEEVRTMPDQTLAQAMARTHHDFQNEGPVMLSLACDNTKFIVERNGVVRFHPGPFQWLGQNQQVDWSPWYAAAAEVRPQFGIANPGAGGPTTATASPAVELKRKLDGGWLPIPVLTAQKNGIEYSQRVFVAPYGDNAGSTAPWGRKSTCVIVLTASNPSSTPAPARLALSFQSNARQNTAAALAITTNGVLVSAHNESLALVVVSGETNSVHLDPPHGALDWSSELSPGKTESLVVYLPGEGLGPADVPGLSGAPQLQVATRQYWETTLAGALQVQTPDELLNNIIRSSQVRCLIDARSEADATRFGASIAAMSYGPLESEAHSVIRGMDHLGHAEFARRSLDFFIHRYNTNGFLTTGYTTFGTAWHLWTIGEHYQLTRDTNWLRQVAPELARVCHWVVRQTEKTRKLDPSGRPVPEFGLTPPGVLADWNSFAYHFAMNAYYVAALREIGAALRDLGHPDAKLFSNAAHELRKNTLRAYAWTQERSPALPLRNGTWIPHYPSQVHSPGKLAEFFPGQDAGRSWCYDVEIGAHQLVPTGVLDPRSREVTRFMDHMEDAQFLSDGWFDYAGSANRADWFNLGGFSKVQPYYTRNCEVYALRDEVKPFVRSYFNSIASLINPEVLTFWEHFHHSGAWDKTHETGYFLHQTRTMLVQERADELWLAPFITSNWLKDGEHLAVTNAPTRFGTVSYDILSHINSGTISAHIQPPTRQIPKLIVLRLRHPEGLPIRAVALNGKGITSFDPRAETVIFKPSQKPVLLEARY